MNIPSATYRLLWAFTALTMLLSMSVPAGLHAAGLAGICNMDMDMTSHEMTSMPETDHSDHCDLANHHRSEHDKVNKSVDTGADHCPLGYTCSCSMDEAAAKPNAIPTLSKVSAGYSPVVVQLLDFSDDPQHPNPSEQVFASLYSPPLFLKNSSFLN